MSRVLRRWLFLSLLAVLGIVVFYRLCEPEWQFTGFVSRRPASPIEHQPPMRWKMRQEIFPLSSYSTLPVGKSAEIPIIQADFPTESEDGRARRVKRQQAVRDAFVKSWKGYERHAWMHDEISPLTGGYKDTFGAWGASLVDSLDVLWIMGMEKEFAIAVAALHKIDFSKTPREILNVFETTIRYLGGLLSAHDLSDGKYPILMAKAVELGDMLYAAFDTPNRMPMTRWAWEITAQHISQQASVNTLAAEIGSLTLEFTRLSQITGDMKYYDAVQRISDELEKQQDLTMIPGLWPITLDAATLNFTKDHMFTLGGMADSLYEYIPKEYLMLGGVTQYRSMYVKWIEAAKKHLFFRPMVPNDVDILVSGTMKKVFDGSFHLDPQAQHLTCFIGGVLAISSKIFERPQDLITAKKLVHGCIWAYETAPNGIMPELFRLKPCPDMEKCEWNESEWYRAIVKSAEDNLETKNNDELAQMKIKKANLPRGFTDVLDPKYILRPEAIESVFILYRITGDSKYQEIAWTMFSAIEKHCKTTISFAALSNVMAKKPLQLDSQESFWMAETLKYFYLIFSEPKLISLDEYVFNTEAHPFKRPVYD